MTHVFADDDQASMAIFGGLPLQRLALSPGRDQAPSWTQELDLAPALEPSPAPSWPVGRDLAPAMVAGKGVRAVRCAGCQRETFPRADDGAPLCARCCEGLAELSSRPRLPLPERWRRVRR